MSEKERKLWHQSGVNPQGQGFIQLILDGEIIAQMDPWEARDHARAITEAAEAAEQDAFLMHFLQTRIGIDFERAGQVLIDFRRFRESQTTKSGGPSRQEDWILPKDRPKDWILPKDKKP